MPFSVRDVQRPVCGMVFAPSGQLEENHDPGCFPAILASWASTTSRVILLSAPKSL